MIDDFKPYQPAAKSLPKKLTSTEKAETTPEAPFVTPDVVAAGETEGVSEAADPALASDKSPETIKNAKSPRKVAFHWPPSKKEVIITAVLIVILAGGGAGWALTRKAPPPVVVTHKIVKKVAVVPPKPTTVPSTLSGLQVDAARNNRPVTGVMIENSMEARPQAGLGEASVVFEAIAEGGITRFLALYQDTMPTNIGPIRSARPYYEQWALGFDAGYAHVGGSPEAINDIKTWGVRDLDQFYNGASYHRITARPAPHNVYTGIDVLVQLEIAKGYATSNFTGFVRKPSEAPSKLPTAKSIDLAISGPVFNVHYDYDGVGNNYKRSEGGAPHYDANTNTQISPKVVVALVIPYSLEPDGYHSSYNTLGTGQAYIFQDGTVSLVQWTKASGTVQFTFTDATGKTIALNPGQTWLTAVSSLGSVTYSP